MAVRGGVAATIVGKHSVSESESSDLRMEDVRM
jgi:hypothetical protein